MTYHSKISIGIWGYGIVGKSAVRYFLQQGYTVGLMEKKPLTADDRDYLDTHNVSVYNETEKNLFFNFHDFLFSSPGINIASYYPTRKHKWITELDVYYNSTQKPIIAITGSVGKTSCTRMLASLFESSDIPLSVGGNIGIAMLDLLPYDADRTVTLLEVSSFQLEYCQSFAPYLAIITNFHPNHLDHHETEENYLLAKCAIFKHQKENSHSLVPLTLKPVIPAAKTNHKRSYFHANKPSAEQLANVQINEQLYYCQDNAVYCYNGLITRPILIIDANNTTSFIENIVIMAAACDILNLNNAGLNARELKSKLPEHRLEHIGCHNQVNFYNDSKATTTASTLAAVKQLKSTSLHLFIGGLSKGVDRASFIAQLKNEAQHIYCFGAEANTLYTMCINNSFSASRFDTLDEAFTACTLAIMPGDCVLLSPAGSSYDLYENYEKRGNHFKELTTHYIRKHKAL